jgi:hypothetical protein
MLFSDHLSEQEFLEAKGAGREELLEMLVSDFKRAFCDLNFESKEESRVINAFASRLNDERTVTVYGGLAFHPKLGAHALAFILLHEAGHHLAKGCRLRRDPALACECAADYWAATAGAKILRRASGRPLNIQAAIDELSVVMGTRQRLNKRYSKTSVSSDCWARSWTLRSRALLKRIEPPNDNGCCVTYA